MIGICHVLAPMMYDRTVSLLSMLPTSSSPSVVVVAVAVVLLLMLTEEEEEELAGHHHEEEDCENCKSLLLLGWECDGNGDASAEAGVWLLL